jgi:uncharacterized protein
VQTFEAAVRNWLKLPSSGMCIFNATCGHGLALEHNGDLYSCDHFVEPGYRLGNVAQNHLLEMVGSEKQRTFGRNKLEVLPRSCRECEVWFACKGECPKNRFDVTPNGEAGLNYLCAGYKAFFRHIDRPLKIMAQLLHQEKPASQVMQVLAVEELKAATASGRVGRNDPCPCGSGLKYKKCHGGTRVAASRKNQQQPGGPLP